MTTADVLRALRGAAATIVLLFAPLLLVFAVGRRDVAFAASIIWKLVVFPHDWMYRNSEPIIAGRPAALVGLAQWLVVAIIVGCATRHMSFGKQIAACFVAIALTSTGVYFVPILFGVHISFNLP